MPLPKYQNMKSEWVLLLCGVWGVWLRSSTKCYTRYTQDKINTSPSSLKKRENGINSDFWMKVTQRVVCFLLRQTTCISDNCLVVTRFLDKSRLGKDRSVLAHSFRLLSAMAARVWGSWSHGIRSGGGGDVHWCSAPFIQFDPQSTEQWHATVKVCLPTSDKLM